MVKIDVVNNKNYGIQWLKSMLSMTKIMEFNG
jgi:hypothetical protein